MRSTGWQCLLPLVAVAAIALTPGCGAVASQTAVGEAEHQLNEAAALGAEEFAPYEFTRATTYFWKAKKLLGEGLFEQSTDYANLAKLAAEKSQDVARIGKEHKQRLQKFAPKDDATVRPAPPAAGTPAGKPFVAPVAGSEVGVP